MWIVLLHFPVRTYVKFDVPGNCKYNSGSNKLCVHLSNLEDNSIYNVQCQGHVFEDWCNLKGKDLMDFKT